MKLSTAIEFALALLKGIASATPTPLDDLAVSAVSAAVTELQRVQGSPVTKDQLESLRVTPQW